MDILDKDSEPIGYRIKKKLGNRANKIRNRPGDKAEEHIPNVLNRNITPSRTAGAAGAMVATALEDVLGLPFGATVDVVDVQPSGEYDIYTVNVNAPTQNMAEARAFIDSTTGFTSYITDVYDVDEVEILNKRPLRDTYQIELRVKK